MPMAALDTSVIPNQEIALTELTISDDADHTVNLAALAFKATILQVRSDGNFHCGSALPVQANDLWFDSGQVWSIPVKDAATWHFMRQSGAGTIHIWLKALGTN